MVQTSRNALNELLVQLGYSAAPRWPEKRIRSVIAKLPSTVDDETDAGDHADLLDELLAAVEDNVEIVITESDDEEEAPARKSKKGAKKAPVKKASKAAAPAKKSAKKVPAKATKVTKKKSKTPVPRKTVKGKSNKQVVYQMYAKNPDKAGERVAQMLEAVDNAVKEQTIRSWISQWRRGENFPSGVEG